MEKNLLSAKEAKKIAESSECQLKRLSKEIELAAKENRSRLCWCLYDTNNFVKKSIIETLLEAGYTVKSIIYVNEIESTTIKHIVDKNISDCSDIEEIEINW